MLSQEDDTSKDRTYALIPNYLISTVLKAPEEHGRLWHALHPKKRSRMGHTPLNSPFSGCEAHHIDQEHVIYIPKALHRSIPHNVWTGKNMEKINALAQAYLKTMT